MNLINCEINLRVTWQANCVITNSTEAEIFKITDTKLYVSVLILSIQDNKKLLQQWKSELKREINWNKYHSTVSIQAHTHTHTHAHTHKRLLDWS